MKNLKNVFLMAFVSLFMIATFATLVSSCSKDDDDKSSLVGTTWKAPFGDLSVVLKFASGTTGVQTIINNSTSETVETKNFTYTYDATTGIVHVDIDGSIGNGTVVGNTMTVVAPDRDGATITLIFTKQQ